MNLISKGFSDIFNINDKENISLKSNLSPDIERKKNDYKLKIICKTNKPPPQKYNKQQYIIINKIIKN